MRTHGDPGGSRAGKAVTECGAMQAVGRRSLLRGLGGPGASRLACPGPSLAVGRLGPFLGHQKLRNSWLALDLPLGHLGVGGHHLNSAASSILPEPWDLTLRGQNHRPAWRLQSHGQTWARGWSIDKLRPVDGAWPNSGPVGGILGKTEGF